MDGQYYKGQIEILLQRNRKLLALEQFYAHCMLILISKNTTVHSKNTVYHGLFNGVSNVLI